jgi:type VI secretion system protein ImpK
MNGDQTLVPQDERSRIRGLIDQGEAIVGSSEEWELIKYGLVSWIDEMLVETPWDGRDWWSNNVLEVELFNTRLCNEEFYAKAREASTHARRDALEVFYVCVVLGFRGLYRDPAMAAVLTQSLELPPDLETWARQAVMSIRLGQGRPALAAPAREIRGAPPQHTRRLMVWSWLAAGMLSLTLAVSYAIWFSKP